MRVSCAQYAVRDSDPDANRERSLAAILDAAKGGADLVVLPELANSGCDFPSHEHALGLGPMGMAPLHRSLAEMSHA